MSRCSEARLPKRSPEYRGAGKAWADSRPDCSGAGIRPAGHRGCSGADRGGVGRAWADKGEADKTFADKTG